MTQDADTLQSKAMLSMLDLISEGPIGGLINGAKSIFINDTPVQNPDGTPNFTCLNADGTVSTTAVIWDQRLGTQSQSVINDFSGVESPDPNGSVEVRNDTPHVFTVSNTNATSVRVIVSMPSCMIQDSNGDVHGTKVDFKFQMSVNGGSYADCSDVLSIDGKSHGKYQISRSINLPKPATSYSLKMLRITADTTDTTISNKTYFDGFSEVTGATLNYPNSALVGLTIDSQLLSSAPRRAYLVSGLYIKVPSNYNPITRSYTGVWDGTFISVISNNPAWVLFDLLTQKRYGLGQYIPTTITDTGGVTALSYAQPDVSGLTRKYTIATQVDKAKLYAIGRYCDGVDTNGTYVGVPTGLTTLTPDYVGPATPTYCEPRFTINTVISTLSDAYKLIADITSVFRGMSYWDGSQVGTMADMPTTPSMVYTQANVVDGLFTYAGSAKRDRHSVANVTWNNPEDVFRQTIEYVEDATLIAKYGIRKLDTVAFGCTSRGQAHRAGLWMLYTEKFESDMISFRVGLDSDFVMPGDVIKIHDPYRAGTRLGGRLQSATTTSALLDAPVTLANAGALISMRLPDGTFQDCTLTNGIGTFQTVNWTTPIAVAPVANAIWIISESSLVPLQARVISVAQDKEIGGYGITAIEHNESKYAAIELGLKLNEPQISIIAANAVTVPFNATTAEVPYLVAPGVMGIRLLASWQGTAPSYEVSWMRTGAFPTTLVTEMSSNPTFDIENIRAGVYYFSVVAINTFGNRSTPLIFNMTSLGVTQNPANYDTFAVTYAGDGTRRYAFAYTTTLKPVSLAGAVIKYVAGTVSSPAWGTMTALYDGVQTAAFESAALAAGAYTFAIKAQDIAGAQSVTPVYFQVTLPAISSTALALSLAVSGARVAFALVAAAATPSASPLIYTNVAADALPPANTWAMTETWVGSLPTISAGQVVFQTDGIYDATTGNTTWRKPYLATLKVASLSALTASTGDLSVTGNLTMSATSAIMGGQTAYNTGTGFFMGYSAALTKYVVSIGGLTFDGTTLRVPAGNITGTISTAQFGDDHLIINPAGSDIDVELRFNRTTGGSASFTWNGTLIQSSKPFLPNQLGINNIVATEPATPFAGQVWFQP